LNAAVLFVSGKPWGVTPAFGLWGSKVLGALGIDVADWAFWKVPANAKALAGSVFADRVSVLDFGIIVGALVASAAGGAFVLHRRVPWRLALGSVLGGITMGYGAQLAGGCNIGGYFSGIASFSLHGWVWGITALLGTFVGLRLRPLFGLTNPRPTDSIC
ncbi:MAG TPA: YeeE/YedE thiosulfate transporter family protein, partial [Pseudonocardia sp.]